MTRKQALNNIFAEVAKTGKTDQALRIYVENRIGYESYMATVHKALKVYKEMQTGKTYGEVVFK